MTILSANDRHVGQALASARRSAGWTREQLAPVIGLSPSELAEAEGGRRRLQTVDLLGASAALKTPPGRLLEIITSGDTNHVGLDAGG